MGKARKSNNRNPAAQASPGKPAPAARPAPLPPPPAGKPWLLATAALCEVGWLGFLLALAIRSATLR
jgi:hypothetical protein